jgi:hypothetical protein
MNETNTDSGAKALQIGLRKIQLNGVADKVIAVLKENHLTDNESHIVLSIAIRRLLIPESEGQVSA